MGNIWSKLSHGPVNFTRTAEGGHRLGMNSWQLLRWHCQWMALLSYICTETEFEHSDNHLWHLRYGSSIKQMGKYLLKASSSHWKGHLVLQWPCCSWAARTLLCLWTDIFQKLVLWVVFLNEFSQVRQKNSAVRCAKCQVLVATHEVTTASQQITVRNVIKIRKPATFSFSFVQQNHFIWNFSLWGTC